jgi:hypothetical protein
LSSGSRLRGLAAGLEARSGALAEVRAALPARLAPHVAAASLEQGELTIGVTAAVWASRLRYATDVLAKRVGQSMKVEIVRVRIRVVPAQPSRTSRIRP